MADSQSVDLPDALSTPPHGKVNVIVSVPSGDSSSPQTSPVEGSDALKAKRLSLTLPILRVEQLKEEGCSSPGSSAYNSEDSEFSDTDIVNRLGEFVPPSEELAIKIAEQVRIVYLVHFVIV